MNVPAVSRTGLLPSFSPGTELQDSAQREIPRHFDHLLGFNIGYANYRGGQDESLFSGPETRLNDPDDITGERAGFERIFDYVDIGPVWFDAQRWFEPNQVSYLPDDTTNPLGLRERMFNRVVETLQPPFNFVGKHRTPGRVNLNTTPDYIRRGGNYSSTFPTPTPPVDPVLVPERFLDAGERPNALLTAGTGGVNANPNNNTNNGNGFSSQFFNSSLYGNGSVHRALTWGISTAYELDDAYGAPVVMGQFNNYDQSVDTRFGRSFKAFIESRRGYASTNRGAVLETRSWTGVIPLSLPASSRLRVRQRCPACSDSCEPNRPKVLRFAGEHMTWV